ncbi:hypothetical protein HELRODRAFT_185211 [Helobdella robusta]|uniref:Dehydrogenase/reductase SDR family member 4 n=1 Tax=Helobdella robusta TaxID=6412 RepID=T1FMI5_HELRO|nr:hypothetical protein HELRODRAFT_185211 [Helobdella robusta]ESN90490.1 hypothetical protein HELRODRAFT_185211 [Helobdella robusta]
MSNLGKYKCKRLDGKVAIVTASSLGIGYCIAERLAHEGAKVVISSRKKHLVDKAVEKLREQGLEVHGTVCHVGLEEDREKLFKLATDLYGGLDILVSNAAINPSFGSVFDTEEETWDKIFEINVKDTFLLCKEALPYLEKRKGGSIVIVSSIAGFTPFEVIGAYSISKTALFGMVKAFVPELTKRNIRINAIAPGVIKTKFTQAMWETRDIEKSTEAIIPMKRLGRPEECSGAVAFLVSDDASYVTGETIVIGGGLVSRL